MTVFSRLLVFFLVVFSAAGAAAADTGGKGVIYADAGKLTAISNALFKTGILSVDDPAAIEEYIRIHHCGVYEQYAQDDFSWNRIRETQARDLELNLPGIPDGLEVSSGLRLTQYDLNKNEFTIDEPQRMSNMGLLTLFNDPSGNFNPCLGNQYSSFVPRVHPLSLILKLDRPVDLAGVPMSRQAADDLISVMNKRRGNEAEKRQVTLVMRVRINGMDPLSGITDRMRRTVQGTLDEIRIYESPARKMLLYKKDFKSPGDGKNKN